MLVLDTESRVITLNQKILDLQSFPVGRYAITLSVTDEFEASKYLTLQVDFKCDDSAREIIRS